MSGQRLGTYHNRALELHLCRSHNQVDLAWKALETMLNAYTKGSQLLVCSTLCSHATLILCQTSHRSEPILLARELGDQPSGPLDRRIAQQLEILRDLEDPFVILY